MANNSTRSAKTKVIHAGVLLADPDIKPKSEQSILIEGGVVRRARGISRRVRGRGDLSAGTGGDGAGLPRTRRDRWASQTRGGGTDLRLVWPQSAAGAGL